MNVYHKQLVKELSEELSIELNAAHKLLQATEAIADIGLPNVLNKDLFKEAAIVVFNSDTLAIVRGIVNKG